MIGAILLVGAIGLLDLRILGYAREASLPALARALTPLAASGFILMVASGAVLFAADATALVGSRLFLIKLGLILIAGMNALAFRVIFARHTGAMSGLAKGLAAASLGLWLAVVIAGRWIAYA